MKKKILLFSAASAFLAAFIAISFTALNNDPLTLTRALASAGYLVLLSVGTFFVGLAFPRD